MIALTSVAGTKIQIVTSAAGAIDQFASIVDRDENAGTTYEQSTVLDINPPQITTATTTDVIVAPASGFKRNVRLLVVSNVHASVANTVTVKHTDGTVTSELFKCTLSAGERLVINESGVPFVYDATGAVKSGAGVGRIIKTTVLTSGTSFTTAPGTNQIFVRVQGAGGGGGGCSSVAAAASAGGGGGGGSYAEKTFAVSPNTAYAYTIGAAGNGSSGAAGGNGGSSTFVVGATTVTAPGGSGAPLATALTTLSAYLGGAPGTIATNGDLNSGGAPGEGGVTLIVATPIVLSGNGGNSNFGSGGIGRTTVGNGNNAVGFGAGGGGAATGASAVRTGGNGIGGVIIVDEYS